MQTLLVPVVAQGGLLLCCLSDGNGNNGLADGAEGKSGKFDMLPGEGDTNDGDGTGEGAAQMSESDPESRKQQPDDIADAAKDAGADIGLSCQHITRDRHGAEGQKGKFPHDKAGASPRNADDADEAEQPGHPPGETHEYAAENEPQDIAETAESLHACASVGTGRKKARVSGLCIVKS